MPRRARFVLSGTPHHVTQRGNRRQDVFFSDQGRSRYLELVREHSLRHELGVLGWCLMTNHVHLIVVPGHAQSMGLALREAHSRYSLEVNREQGWDGHLWRNRYFSCALEDDHFLTALRYVELNPVRAGLVARASDWRWFERAGALEFGSAGRFVGWGVGAVDAGCTIGGLTGANRDGRHYFRDFLWLRRTHLICRVVPVLCFPAHRIKLPTRQSPAGRVLLGSGPQPLSGTSQRTLAPSWAWRFGLVPDDKSCSSHRRAGPFPIDGASVERSAFAILTGSEPRVGMGRAPVAKSVFLMCPGGRSLSAGAALCVPNLALCPPRILTPKRKTAV
jgi:REP element-mobilizing transposase RayT